MRMIKPMIPREGHEHEPDVLVKVLDIDNKYCLVAVFIADAQHIYQKIRLVFMSLSWNHRLNHSHDCPVSTQGIFLESSFDIV